MQAWSVTGRSYVLNALRTEAWLSTRKAHLQLHRALYSSQQNSDETPMEKVRTLTYNPGPLNVLVFEDVTDEYRAIEASNPSTRGVSSVPENEIFSQSLCEALVRLVEKRDLVGADLAKQELKKFGIQIQHNPVYSQAALLALQVEEGQVRRKVFFDWLSITPDEAWISIFPQVRRTLLEDPLDIALICDICVSFASRGAVSQTEVALFTHVLRYSPFMDGFTFLTDFENAYSGWLKRNTIRDPRDWHFWRNLAIRVLSLKYDATSAVRLLDDSRRRGVVITKQTYYAMLSHLQGPGQVFKAQIEAAMRRDGFKEIPTFPSTPHTTLLPLKKTSEGSIEHSKSHVAATLRRLRNSIRLTPYKPIQFTKLLADFMFDYELVHFRRRATDILRREVFSNKFSTFVKRQWVVAEQTYMINTHQPVNSMRLFLHFCIADGLPTFDIRKFLKTTKVTKSQDLIDRLIPREDKIRPSTQNLHRAWKALVMMTVNRKDMERMYDVLVAEAQYFKKLDSFSDSDSVPEDQLKDPLLPRILSPTARPDPCFFQPFIVGFAYRVGPRRAALVLRDMGDLGIPTTRDNWAVFAAASARFGLTQHVEAALGVLNKDLEDLQAKVTFESREPPPEELSNAAVLDTTTLPELSAEDLAFEGNLDEVLQNFDLNLNLDLFSPPETKLSSNPLPDIIEEPSLDEPPPTILSDDPTRTPDQSLFEQGYMATSFLPPPLTSSSLHLAPTSRTRSQTRLLRARHKMLITYNYIMRNFTEAGLYPEARAIHSLMSKEGYMDLDGKGVDYRTAAILHRLSQCERGVLKRTNILKRGKAVNIDGRFMYVNERRRTWMEREPQSAE